MKQINHEIPLRTVSLEFAKEIKERKITRKKLCYSSNYKQQCLARLSVNQNRIPNTSKIYSPYPNSKTITCTPLNTENSSQTFLKKNSQAQIKDMKMEKLGLDARSQHKVPKSRAEVETIVIEPDQLIIKGKESKAQVQKEMKKCCLSKNIKEHGTSRSQSATKQTQKAKQLYKTNQINLSGPFNNNFTYSFPMHEKISMVSINKMYDACMKDMKDQYIQKKKTIKTQAKLTSNPIEKQVNKWIQTLSREPKISQSQVLKQKPKQNQQFFQHSYDLTRTILVKRKDLDPAKQQLAFKLKKEKLLHKRSEQKLKMYKKRKSCTLEDDFKVAGWQQSFHEFEESQQIFTNQ